MTKKRIGTLAGGPEEPAATVAVDDGMLRSACVPASLVLADGALVHVRGWPSPAEPGRAA